jgi:gliding motility-associated-like protein
MGYIPARRIKIILVIWILLCPGQAMLSQRVSRDNYTGNWETPSSWEPIWAEPLTSLTGPGLVISIYGYITVNSSLDFYGPSTNLIIYDTLVIKGDLILGNNNKLTVMDGGVIIIRGNLSFHDNSIIMGNGYIIVTGDIIKTGGQNLGSFTSNDDPVKIFIGGTVPAILTDDPNYPVLNCSSPSTETYPDTGCSYGNLITIEDEPIFDFFQSTCAIVTVHSNSPVCSGLAINLASTGGNSYLWSGPGGFTSTLQNPSLTAADATMTGTYKVSVTANNCSVVKYTQVMVNPLPVVVINDPAPICSPDRVDLSSPNVTSGSTPGLAWSYHPDAEGTVVYATPYAASSGTWYIKGTNEYGCSEIRPVTVIINPSPTVVISDPAPQCSPATIDITLPSVTAGSTPGVTWSYHTDPGGTAIYPTPGEASNGTWYIRGTTAEGCYQVKAVNVIINPSPIVEITSSGSPMCTGDHILLTGYPEGGNFTITGGPGNISQNTLWATGGGHLFLEYHYEGVCPGMADQSIIVNEYPVADAGPDQELYFIFETRMQASISHFEAGEWSLISGSGHIHESTDPKTRITNLAIGDNIFWWTVNKGTCEAGAEVKITVNDLFIPSVITPNGDGKNDYFILGNINGPAELIIMNRWGIMEFMDRNYNNNWDGRNNKGAILPNDTYFYILKLDNNLIRKGTVLIHR